MQEDKVCVAALNRGKSLRLHNPTPREQWLTSIGSLTPGDIVSLSWKLARRYHRPHLEDGDWNPATFAKVDLLPEDELVKRLSANAFRSIDHAFGKPCFHSENGNAAFVPGKGSRSLASVIVSSVRAYPHGEGVRADFADSRGEWRMVPVEDLAIRNHQMQCSSCASDLPKLLASEFQGSRALLRVGLGRPFQSSDSATACWLQVNHIFLIPSKRHHFV
jgi:hypothetical protein